MNWIDKYVEDRQAEQKERSAAFVSDYAKQLETFKPQEIVCNCCHFSMGVVFVAKDEKQKSSSLMVCQECQDALVQLLPHCDCCIGRGCGACSLCYGEDTTSHEPLACQYRRPKFVSN